MVHELLVKGRLLSVKPEGACCPFCRQPLTETRYLSRWCNLHHYTGWCEAEDGREEQIARGSEPEEFYQEPYCALCRYWFPTEEALQKHKEDESRGNQ